MVPLSKTDMRSSLQGRMKMLKISQNKICHRYFFQKQNF